MKHILVLCVLIVLAFGSCTKPPHWENVSVIETPLFNGYVRYLVATEGYVRVFETQDITSAVLGFVRRGEVLELRNTAKEDAIGYGWYHIRSPTVEGWIFTYKPYLFYLLEQARLTGVLLM